MPGCPDCGFDAKTGGGLASHRRAKHPPDEEEERPASNAAAVEMTLRQLRADGRLDDKADTALIHLLRSLAAAVDLKPEKAALWKAYREALTEVLRPDDDEDAASRAMARVSAPVRD